MPAWPTSSPSGDAGASASAYVRQREGLPRSRSTALFALIGTGIASPVSAAPDNTPKVPVFGQEDQIVAEFTTAKCRRSHGSFLALTPRVNGYRMFVSIDGLVFAGGLECRYKKKGK